MTTIVSMGGGFTSTAWLPRVMLEKHDKTDLRFVTCVLPNEHPSMWKLFDAVEDTLQIEVEYIAYHPDTKYQIVNKADRTNTDILFTPFDIFNKVRLLGNSRLDPCSRMLKRETMLAFVKDQSDVNTLAVGIHSDEYDRFLAIHKNWQSQGYDVIFPLLDLPAPRNENELIREWYGVAVPMYDAGFIHNNCHGACVKAGQRQWARLLYTYPDVYAQWEQMEADFIENIGKRVTIMYRSIDGDRTYITLAEFREYVESLVCSGTDNFLTQMIDTLPDTAPCVYCAAI